MPIARDSRGFLYADDIGITPMLGMESAKLDACIAEVNRRNLLGVFGTLPYFTERNLDFLTRLPSLKQVWLYEAELTNCDGIYAHPDLELFLCYKRKMGIDFTRLKKLKHLIWHYQPKDTGIGTLSSLRQMDIWHYNPKSKAFADCQIASSIERLEINWANPQTLDGLPNMPNLKELQLHYCRNLTSVEDLIELAPNLEKLVIANCKKCDVTPETLKSLSSLTFAFVNKPPAFGSR